MYNTKEEIESAWAELKDIYSQESFKMQSIENYRVEIFANGRLAALMIETEDNRFKGNTVLWAKVNYAGGLRPFFINTFFYLPQGNEEFEAY